MVEPTKQQLLDSLYSRTCPACGEYKASEMTFCGECYRSLHRSDALALYRKFGRGYEEAIERALDLLGVQRFYEAKESP